MGKAILVLVVLFVAVVGYLVWSGYQRVAEKEKPKSAALTDEKEGPGVFDQAAKEAGELANKAENLAKKGAAEIKDALKTKLKLTFSPTVVEVQRGQRVEVKVTRGTSELPALQLTLTPAAGSGLTAKGGAFKSGERTAVIELTAAQDAKAQDANVTLSYEDFSMLMPVRVK